MTHPKQELINQLEAEQLELKEWATFLRMESSKVMLERASLLRKLDRLKREVFVEANGVTTDNRKGLERKQEKISSVLNNLTPEEKQKLARALMNMSRGGK